MNIVRIAGQKAKKLCISRLTFWINEPRRDVAFEVSCKVGNDSVGEFFSSMVCFLVDNFWKSAFSLVSSDSDGILLSPLACRIKLVLSALPPLDFDIFRTRFCWHSCGCRRLCTSSLRAGSWEGQLGSRRLVPPPWEESI